MREKFIDEVLMSVMENKWFMPVILATWVAGIMRITVQGHGKKSERVQLNQ
jgi:hypothetical protein